MLTLGKLKELALNELKQIFDINEENFRLEEYEYNDLMKQSQIIVSFLIENQNVEISPLKLSLGGMKFERVYKKVIIDDEGKVIKFSIYNPQR